MAAKSRPAQYALYARLNSESERSRRRIERQLDCTTSQMIQRAIQALEAQLVAENAEPAK
jgi:hypothetical protein